MGGGTSKEEGLSRPLLPAAVASPSYDEEATNSKWPPRVQRNSALLSASLVLVSIGAVCWFGASSNWWRTASGSEDSMGVKTFGVSQSDKCQLCAQGSFELESASDGMTNVALRYRDSTTTSDEGWLWTPLTTVEAGDSSATIDFCRMRFRTTYTVELWLQTNATLDAELAATDSVSTGSIGFATIDLGPFADVQGSSTWSSDLIFTYVSAVAAGDSSATMSRKADIRSMGMEVDDGVDGA